MTPKRWERKVKTRKTAPAAAVVAVVLVLVLTSCAPQANQIGAAIPVPPIGSLFTGLLQGAFILWVALWNLLSYAFNWGHFDIYQDGAGLWYDIGFMLGLVLGAGVGFFGFNLFRR